MATSHFDVAYCSSYYEGITMHMLQNLKSGIKNSAFTLLELAQVRLEMARIELNEQKNQLILTLALVLLSSIFLLISFISLLFGLNTILSEEQKVWVFFLISGMGILFVFILGGIVISSLKKQRHFMEATLQEVKLDIEAMKKATQLKQDNIKE
nr:phage holin family protein [Pasteurella bettyae]